MEVAIVLAGGPPDELVAGRPDAPNKAFLKIGGKALVERTLEPLRATESIKKLIVVAPPAAHGSPALALATEVRADGPSIVDSMRSGLAGLHPDDLVLLAAADLPVLSLEAVEEFAGLAERSNADVVYACVERKTHLARFPQVPHTWAKLRDGTFCGGGCIALRPRAFPALERFLDRLGTARKNPVQLAALFGWDFLLRYPFGLISIAGLERRASAALGAPVAAAVCSRAEIAVNVDRPSDVALAEQLVTMPA
jgi:molybdopterin-guanine dinucleotide biosynthesis protein A